MNRDRPRVLIVEDNADTAAALRQLFSLWHWDVILAATCDEALGKADIPADLVLLDLMLPDRSGVEVLRWHRENGSAVPIVVATAAELSAPAREALALRPDHFLPKPVAYAELKAIARSYLDAFYAARPGLTNRAAAEDLAAAEAVRPDPPQAKAKANGNGKGKAKGK